MLGTETTVAFNAETNRNEFVLVSFCSGERPKWRWQGIEHMWKCNTIGDDAYAAIHKRSLEIGTALPWKSTAQAIGEAITAGAI